MAPVGGGGGGGELSDQVYTTLCTIFWKNVVFSCFVSDEQKKREKKTDKKEKFDQLKSPLTIILMYV